MNDCPCPELHAEAELLGKMFAEFGRFIYGLNAEEETAVCSAIQNSLLNYTQLNGIPPVYYAELKRLTRQYLKGEDKWETPPQQQ